MARRSPLLHDGRALEDARRLLDSGLADRRASFELSFVRLPAHTGFAVIAGVELLLEMLARPLIDAVEAAEALEAGLLSPALAERLGRAPLSVDIDAMMDGTVAFARMPIASVEGPMLEALLVGSLVRAGLSRATAIATRTARLCAAAQGDAIIDASSALAATPGEALAIARAAHVGGAAETTNLAAARALGVPFRAAKRLDLSALGAAPSTTEGVWGASSADAVMELGDAGDEEALLLEAKRLGAIAGGWLAQGLGDASATALPTCFELVAIEEDGAWSPRRGASGHADVEPGRKMVARYMDASGRAMVDVVHLSHERVQAPKTVLAATLSQLAKPLVRAGRTLEAPEAATKGRERSIAGRRALPDPVGYLRSPGAYRVEPSAALAALLPRKS